MLIVLPLIVRHDRKFPALDRAAWPATKASASARFTGDHVVVMVAHWDAGIVRRLLPEAMLASVMRLDLATAQIRHSSHPHRVPIPK
jgi:hypothetical protein